MSHLERVAILGEVLSQNVQHPDHLREDQHSVSSLSQPGQQFVQQHQLPAALNQALKHSSEFQHKDSFLKKKERKALNPLLVPLCFPLCQLLSFAERRYPGVLPGATQGSLGDVPADDPLVFQFPRPRAV